jgi:hypothetical protein
MILFGLRPGDVTTRDIVLDDMCARFRKAEYLVRIRTNTAIDAAIADGTLSEENGRLQTLGVMTWMLNIEIPTDEWAP